MIRQVGANYWAWPDRTPPIDAARSGRLYYWRSGMPAWRQWRAPASSSPATSPSSTARPSPGVPIGEHDIQYERHPEGCYGRRFGDTRPPGLPESVPCTSARNAAVPKIVELAARYQLPPEFTKAVVGLARNESGAEYYRPANSFDPRPIAERPEGKSRITAYGVFNWNKGAWAGLSERKSYLAEGANGPSAPESTSRQWPWEATPWEQLAYPIDRYAKVFATIIADGGTPLDAAMGIRVWHSGSGRFRAYRRLVQAGGHMPEMWGRMRADDPDWFDEHTPNHYNDLVEWLQATS